MSTTFPRPVPLTPEQADRQTVAAFVEALIADGTALADPRCERVALEASWDIWPFYSLERDVRLAAIAASARVRRAGGAL